MPKRNNTSSDEIDENTRSSEMTTSLNFKFGDIVTDITGKKWKLGTSVGIGGFGEIYDAYENVHKDAKTTDASYVAKFERHSNGPLFVEINCYLRIGRKNIIEDWKKHKSLKYLGMPHYVASGSYTHLDSKYRFLLLPKYKRDLGQILSEKKIFNVKTVLTILIQILDVLEYIHSRGYVHSDIKASNIMLGETSVDLPEIGALPRRKVPVRSTRIAKPICIQPVKEIRVTRTCRNLRPTGVVNYIDDIPYLDEVLNLHENRKKDRYRKEAQKKHGEKKIEHVYLLDYGLASKYILLNGEHREFCTDERRAHAGTTLFCSRDAHKGVASRRSDLESLAYNMIYWLTGSLPWIDDLSEPEEVEKKKIRSFKHLQSFLAFCFNNNCPQFLIDYFSYLNKLQFQETPDYMFCKQIFEKAFITFGYKNDSILDFDDVEGSTKVKLKKLVVRKGANEAGLSFLKTSPLMPLHSNIVFKRPKLRKAAKNKKSLNSSMMHWSKILIDPEEIIKQGRERKVTDGSDGSTNLSPTELESLNPTYAMMEVFNKCKEREISPTYKTDSTPANTIEGYTPAMMAVYLKMKEREELEYQMQLCSENNNYITLTESQTSMKAKRSRINKGTETSAAGKRQLKLNAIVTTKKLAPQTKNSRTALARRPYSLRG